ncbi:right-handed parallel beta-helix repeat-containing protein [Candidatus Sumerlaeota bacterium]|nr:right-handed parallel beta-helix repeat-containing protein [Candidatus Sumerlaeota bacterium]
MKTLSAIVAVIVFSGLGGRVPAATLQSVFDATVGNTMNLSAGATYTGGLNINRNITINGNGALLTMNRSAVERINVNSGLAVTINNLRVQGGFSVAKFATGSTGTLNGITASNLETAIEHDGSGTLNVTGSTFSDLTSRGIITFGAKNSTAMTVNIQNVEFRNAQFGIQFEGGAKLNATNTSFVNVTNAIWTTGGQLGTPANRSKLTGCTFNGGDFGVVLLAGTHTDILGCTSLGYRYPFQVKNGADASMTNTVILQNGVSNPSVAVSVTDGATLRAVNSQVTGYMNSFDTSINGTMDIDRCTMTHPAFSGIICKDDSVANVRNSAFIDNGQDSIFFGTDSPGSGDTSRGIIENNLSLNAGVDNQYGTGIALLGSGPYTVRNNIVIGSLDVGVAIKFGATATLEQNQFIDNDKTGIYISSAGNVTLHDNTSAGHTASGQAGLIVDGTNGTITAKRNMFAGNEYGILWRGTAAGSDFDDNFIYRSENQGVSVTQGVINAARSSYINNNGYQVFVTSSGQSNFLDSVFLAPSKLGVYTDRGSCGSSGSNLAQATGGWWGAPAGPRNRCNSSTGQPMEYQNANVSSPRPAAHLETLFTGEIDGIASTSRVPSSSVALPIVTLPGNRKPNAFLGIFRPTPGFSDAAPQQATGQPVYLWTSYGLETTPGAVTLQFPEGTALFAHLNRATGGYDDLIVAQTSGASSTVTIPTNRLANGTWYFLNDSGYGAAIDLLLGRRSSTGVLSGSDLRIDAADL